MPTFWRHTGKPARGGKPASTKCCVSTCREIKSAKSMNLLKMPTNQLNISPNRRPPMQTTRPHCRPFTRWVKRQAILVFIFTAAVILIGGCATVEEVTQRDKELCIERGSALDKIGRAHV